METSFAAFARAADGRLPVAHFARGTTDGRCALNSQGSLGGALLRFAPQSAMADRNVCPPSTGARRTTGGHWGFECRLGAGTGLQTAADQWHPTARRSAREWGAFTMDGAITLECDWVAGWRVASLRSARRHGRQECLPSFYKRASHDGWALGACMRLGSLSGRDGGGSLNGCDTGNENWPPEGGQWVTLVV